MRRNDGIVDLAVGNQRVPERARGGAVDDRNDLFRCHDGGKRNVHGYTQRDISVPVRRRHLDHRDITFEPACAEEVLRVAQSHRQIVRESRVNRLPVVFADEEKIVDEDSRIFFRHVGRRPEGHQLQDADVFKFMPVGTAAEGVQKCFRRVGESAQIDQIAGLHHAYRLVRGYCFRNFSHESPSTSRLRAVGRKNRRSARSDGIRGTSCRSGTA